MTQRTDGCNADDSLDKSADISVRENISIYGLSSALQIDIRADGGTVTEYCPGNCWLFRYKTLVDHECHNCQQPSDERGQDLRRSPGEASTAKCEPRDSKGCSTNNYEIAATSKQFSTKKIAKE
jgi:hypothetical protein